MRLPKHAYGQGKIDDFLNSNNGSPQKLDSIYKEIGKNMDRRFKHSVQVRKYIPKDYDVTVITVLFDRNETPPIYAAHEFITITPVLNDEKLGYLTKERYGNNDYEKPYQMILLGRDIPLSVVPKYKRKERTSVLRRPKYIKTELKSFESPIAFRNSVDQFNDGRASWKKVDDLQMARKKMCYVRKKKSDKSQMRFEEKGGFFTGELTPEGKIFQTTMDETELFIKKSRDPEKRSIRNDIIYMTEKGRMISELKSSGEITKNYLDLLEKQLLAYDAEQVFKHNFDTPLVLGVPVIPPKKELERIAHVKEEARRDVGVLVVADRRRFLLEIKKGIKKLQTRGDRYKNSAEQREFYYEEVEALNGYLKDFS